MPRKGIMTGIDKLELGQANTAMALLPDGRLWALHEGSLPFEFHVTEQGGLASKGYERAEGKLDYSVSAHPKIDVRTGEVIFHGYAADGGEDGKTFLKFGRFDPAGELQSHFRLNATGASFSHDMLLSENFAIVIDSSIRFAPEKIVTGGSPFSFDEGHRTNLAVIPRNASSADEVMWFQPPKSLAWVHPLHAWEEEGGQVVVIWAPLGFASQKEGSVLDGCCDLWHMTELRLDIRTGQVTEMKIIDPDGKHHGEFSRMRDDLTGGGFARFGYTGLANASGEDFDFIGFTKWDMKKKSVGGELRFPAGWFGGEPIFIPNPDKSGDPSDDGFLGTFLFGPEKDSTDFVLYNARTFAEQPVVRLRITRRVPVGFHGAWLDEAGLQRHLARK